MGKKKKQTEDDFVTRMKEEGIEVADNTSSKNSFKRFCKCLLYIPHKIRHCFHNLRMRKLKLGTVCFKDYMLQTINISWDIHWLSNVYIAAIIRDYLRFFIKNTPVVGNYVFVHNPEGYSFEEALEKIDMDIAFERWKKIVNDTADLFDELVKYSDDLDMPIEEYQGKINTAFDALKEIFYDLDW